MNILRSKKIQKIKHNPLLALIKKMLNNRFVKFVLVGGINTLFGFSIFSACVYLTRNPSASVVIGTVLGVLFNFNTYGRLVFKSRDNSRIFRFFAIYLFTMTSQILLLNFFAHIGITSPYVGGAILTLPMALISFTLMRKFVFNTIPAETQDEKQ